MAARRAADTARVTATVTRPLSDDERRVLASLAKGSDLFNDVFGVVFLFLIVLGICAAAIRFTVGPPTGRQMAYVVPFAACAALALFFTLRRRYLGHSVRRERAACAADLAAGRAVVETFEAVDAIRVKEFEDEGSSYYLELAGGGVLFLNGQYLYEAEEDGSFPSTRFAVTRAPASRLLFDLRCDGKPLAVSHERAHFTQEEYRAGKVPRDGARLDVDFESLRAG